MDSQAAAPTPNTQTPTEAEKTGFKAFLIRNKKKLIPAGVVALVVIVLGVFYFNQNIKQIINSNNMGSSGTDDLSGPIASMEIPKNAIAKVGDEYIFQSDLDIELANYPAPKDENAKKVLIAKLVKDSIILQAAKKEKLATVSGEIFNIENKNYGKRFGELRAVEEKLKSSTGGIKGTMVSVWFYNLYPAKIGVEAGKAEALRRITALQKKVKSGEITIEAAGELIKQDSSYANLDAGGYQVNALIPFSEPKGDEITFDKGFNDILWKTNPGEITDVYLAKTINEFSKVDTESYYIFGKVTEKNNGNGQGVQAWYESQKGNYEVTYY